ncbi:DUF4336 domain-containing protein [Mesorhizobium sp. XAP10]|uniref:DUF4336 domain-containing protein n=1 Tax=unclassified Mesorhizobium TaxID=325217 RepID=UPI0023DE718F|nr:MULTISPECIES: DUF4336 domain-containing protein [unclassified Mesorhizobium]MDF3150591.1 DUF4336 domain-containing protein [Mesorhizobium sp. XAP10]MDF3243477.1 DUF4336 domain-containing protein [Mesorhizobium sp. XAP4]
MAGSLKEFGLGIWIADDPIVTAAAGFHYPTRMAVIGLSGGGLFIWSPVELTNELRADVDALGVVRFLIPPNSLHHVFLADWQRGYPDAKVYAPPGLREKRRDILFCGELGDTPAADWADDLDQVVVRGNRITTEIVFFHRASRTVLFTDLIQHFHAGWFKGWRALVARLDLMVAAEPSVPRKFRAGFTDRRAARAALQRILAWPAERVLMAHGEPVTEDAQTFIRRAFRWLVGR